MDRETLRVIRRETQPPAEKEGWTVNGMDSVVGDTDSKHIR